MPDAWGKTQWSLGSFGRVHFASTETEVVELFFSSKEAREYVDRQIALYPDTDRWAPHYDVSGRSVSWLIRQPAEVRDQYRRAFEREPIFPNGMARIDPDYIDMLAAAEAYATAEQIAA